MSRSFLIANYRGDIEIVCQLIDPGSKSTSAQLEREYSENVTDARKYGRQIKPIKIKDKTTVDLSRISTVTADGHNVAIWIIDAYSGKGPWNFIEMANFLPKEYNNRVDKHIYSNKHCRIIIREYEHNYFIVPDSYLDTYFELNSSKVRPKMISPLSPHGIGSDHNPGIDEVDYTQLITSSILTGVVTTLAAMGPKGGVVAGPLYTVGSIVLGSFAGREAERPPTLNILDIKNAMENILAKSNALDAANTIALTQQQLRSWQNELFENELHHYKLNLNDFKSAVVTRLSTKEIESLHQAYKKLQACREKELTSDNNLPQNLKDLRNNFFNFVSSCLDGRSGGFIWEMNFLARNPESLKLIMPEYMEGMASYLELEMIRINKMRYDDLYIAPSRIKDIINNYEIFLAGFFEALCKVTAEIDKIAKEIGVDDILERGYIAMEMSEHYLGDRLGYVDHKTYILYEDAIRVNHPKYISVFGEWVFSDDRSYEHVLELDKRSDFYDDFERKVFYPLLEKYNLVPTEYIENPKTYLSRPYWCGRAIAPFLKNSRDVLGKLKQWVEGLESENNSTPVTQPKPPDHVMIEKI